MKQNGRKIVIIGGGIAGLSAAVYALKCGYEVEVLEMHDMAGGLAMSWRRGSLHIRDLPALAGWLQSERRVSLSLARALRHWKTGICESGRVCSDRN